MGHSLRVEDRLNWMDVVLLETGRDTGREGGGGGGADMVIVWNR